MSAGQRVEVQRHRRDEGLTLASLHLGDVALVEHDCTHHLDVEVAAFRALASRPRAPSRKALENELVERLAVLEALLEFGRLAASSASESASNSGSIDAM